MNRPHVTSSDRMWVTGDAQMRQAGALTLRLVQPITAAASLVILILSLINGFRPAWPLCTIAVVLSLGLLVSPAAWLIDQQTVRRSAHTVAALASLLVLTLWLPRYHTNWQVSPIWVVALLLGAGLVADPLAQYIGGPAPRRFPHSVTAVTALLLLLWEFATIRFFYFTEYPHALHPDFELPMVTLRVVVVTLGFGILAGRLSGEQLVRRFAPVAAAAVALIVLLVVLAEHPRPTWPLWSMAAILAFGFAVDPIAGHTRWPGAEALARRVDELSRTRRGALDVQATELRRIERDLHDGAQVRLVALSMKLGRAEDRYRDDPETAALLREAREDATAAIRELRELARGIAPPVLADRGLEAAVHSLAQRSGSEVTVTGSLDRRPLPATETAAYFVVAESLTNAAKHAPGARVEVCLDERAGDLFVVITDFGPGGADPAGGGLTGLRQRVEALDGTFYVTSAAGVGTQVEAVMSCGW